MDATVFVLLVFFATGEPRTMSMEFKTLKECLGQRVVMMAGPRKVAKADCLWWGAAKPDPPLPSRGRSS